ncbi:serine/threonine-protein kinase [Salinispora arenicola]|uniref:serine/threonine-protein kinase n=1 Tax=Salinispora arenicola TaxID=168697 RepID=UPI0003A3D7F3|nr:serine/threonine-protein kinase [Salinispora arenicola]
MSGADLDDLDVVPTLIARYGQLLGCDHDERERGELLLDILHDLLTASGVQLRPAAPLVGESPTLGLRRGDTKLLGLVWRDSPLTAQDVAIWQQAARRRSNMQVALISMSGFDAHAGEAMDPQSPTVVLLDRTHVEAALCGLLTIEKAMQEVGDRAVFDGTAFTSLTDLLLTAPRHDPPSFVSFTRSPMPWELEIAATGAVSLQHLLSGGAGWGEITGFTVDGPRMLVTTGEGVVEVDTLRGTAHWLLPLAGCSGSALASADGGILVRRGSAVVEWKDGVLTPIAGDLGDTRMLLWGPGGQAWALCGNGAELGGATLGLVRLGGMVGDQQRYSISFDANVLSAAWLGDLRFFLGAEGHSAVVNLSCRTKVRREDWIVSPPSPQYLVALGGEVIAAGSDRTGLPGFLHRVDPAARTTSLVAQMQLNGVQGLGVTAQGRLLLLGDVRGNSQVPHPVIVEVSVGSGIRTAARTGAPTRPVGAEPSAADAVSGAPVDTTVAPSAVAAATADPYMAVRLMAHGERKDYALQPRPITTGGQAQVFRGTHKRTGTPVALKRLRMTGEDQRARMRREVDAAGMFGSNRHVMPVLDFSSSFEWLVMPLADHSAEAMAAALRFDGPLRKLITAICEGMREPHRAGWIHRDLKPANILWLDGRWVVADWGLGRRPRGQTTVPGRTQVGELYGSLGYAAPELYTDAHAVSPQTDIYSIGQIIGWALLQTDPHANVPHLPSAGPWRAVVRAATHHDPRQRPATVDELLALIAAELDSPPTAPVNRGRALIEAACEGDASALPALFRLAADTTSHYELYMEALVHLDDTQIKQAVSADPTTARAVVQGVQELHTGGYVTLEYHDVDNLTRWLLRIARCAESIKAWDLLEDTIDAIFYLDGGWDRWDVRNDIHAWLSERSGVAAAIAAQALRAHPDSIPRFDDLAQQATVDYHIRQAATPATQHASDERIGGSPTAASTPSRRHRPDRPDR